MNRIFPRNARPEPTAEPANPYYRPTRRLREDADVMLRDIAFVLSMTRRVKESILEDRQALEHVEA